MKIKTRDSSNLGRTAYYFGFVICQDLAQLVQTRPRAQVPLLPRTFVTPMDQRNVWFWKEK